MEKWEMTGEDEIDDIFETEGYVNIPETWRARYLYWKW